MDTSRDAVARRYGEHLTDQDLLALTGDRPDQVDALRRRPEPVLDLLDSGVLDPRPLISRHMTLEDAPEAYALYDRREAMKIVLEP